MNPLPLILIVFMFIMNPWAGLAALAAVVLYNAFAD